MQNLSNIQEIEDAVNQYGEIVIRKNKNNNVVVMSMEEYRKKMLDNQIEKKLLKAEKQIARISNSVLSVSHDDFEYISKLLSDFILRFEKEIYS